ncbi:MAG: protelomerase family protein [Phormidesmis sp.]
MPTTVVAPITRETLLPYAKLGKSNSKIQSRICELLFRLAQTDDPAKVKSLCESEIEWLTAEFAKSSTRTSYVSAYRKAMRAYFNEQPIPKSLKVEKQTSKGTVVNHLAESYLMASAEDYDTVRAANKTKTATQRDNLTGFDAAAALEATKQALKSEDWRELAAGLIMATQSRPSDMLKSGGFKAISKYRLEFTSRAKKRGAVAKGEIFGTVQFPRNGGNTFIADQVSTGFF